CRDTAETAHGNELNNLDFKYEPQQGAEREDVLDGPSPSEESLDSQSSDEEFFDSSSSSEDVGPSDKNSQKYKEPYYIASEAIIGEIKNLIVEFEKVFDKELKGEKKYYKNREEKSLPENLFCESLPNYVIAGLFDKKYKATRTRLFDKFLSNEDNKETRWKSVKKALRKHKAVEKQTALEQKALEKQNSLKTESLKKPKSLEKQKALEKAMEKQKALEKQEALEQKALEKQESLEKQKGLEKQTATENQKALEKQKSLSKQNSLKQKFLRKQESLSLKNCKLNWGDVIKYTTKLNDICKVFKQKKDVDSLLLTKMDRFYFNFEDRKNLRKLNR
uniref:Uncharacterized protein n=1 Tax=Meloidogyne javanica TaxID=6303 RepID=A0A915M8E7_MELJA